MPQARLVYIVGRENSASPPDLAVPRSEITVGKRHAELSFLSGGTWRISDLGSKNGTFVRDGDSWKRIAGASIDLELPIRLGEFETTPAALLRLRRASIPPPLLSPPASRPRRNPHTGEVE